MRRTLWVVAVAVPVLLVAGEFAYWRLAVGRLQAGFEDWRAARAAAGWQVESGPGGSGGWPLTARLDVPNLTLRHGGASMPGQLQVAANVALAVSLADPTTLRIGLNGPAHVQVGDLPEVVLSGDEAWASLPLRSDRSPPVDLHAGNLRISPPAASWQATVGLLNGRLLIADPPPADPSRPDATLSLSAEAVALPAGVQWPLGANISSLSLDSALNGRLPANRDIRDWMQGWRDGGGSLGISHLAMGWGPLGLAGSAVLSLDDQLQPMGNGTGHIVGYAAALDRMAASGVLTRSAATAVKAVLSLLAGASESETGSAVDVPLILQSRTLSMHQVPLLRLPALDWPSR